jgi:CheY-like chemotaxis protein
MVHQVAAYQAAGMDGVVSKPIEIARLFAAIETALASQDEGVQEFRAVS